MRCAALGCIAECTALLALRPHEQLLTGVDVMMTRLLIRIALWMPLITHRAPETRTLWQPVRSWAGALVSFHP